MHDVFYFTDVHGCYPLFQAAMDFCIKQDPECMIIFGGDACDREPEGYKIMKELLDNPQVVYLKGNHEDMFVRAARYLKENYTDNLDKEHIYNYLYDSIINKFSNSDVRSCVYNGGYETLTNWMLDGMPMDFVDKIDTRPVTFSYESLDFCHAGGRYTSFQKVALSEYENVPIAKDDYENMIWDRAYLGQGWQPNRTCIFGHTPTVHLAAKYYGKDKSTKNIHPCAYVATLDDKWTGRKIDMDTGVFATGKLYVLNCLTMKAYGFRDIDFTQEENRNHTVEQFEIIQF